MKTHLRSVLPLLLASTVASLSAFAAVPNRLASAVSLGQRTALPQSVSSRVSTSAALGHLSGDTTLQTMSLVLAPSADQSAALDQLLADQQNPASGSYHQWLTPQQFGERFGVSDHDLSVLQSWLTSQGLQVVGVAPSRNQVTFSGTAANVEAAFQTELTRYSRNGQQYFENSTAAQIPAAFDGVVAAVTGLSSFRLQPHSVKPILRPDATPSGISPQATSTSGTTHYLAPWDFRQIYDSNTLVNAGNNGTGITIGVIGQSAVDTAQVTYFQTLTGQTAKAPTVTLVPGTGTSTRVSGDEGESEADLEYATGVAPGATVNFIYTGYVNGSSYGGVIYALQYAITNNLANILTLSYGSCETENTVSSVNALELYLKQANAQGQTIMVSSGDSGAAGCDYSAPTAYSGAQVSYPASSAYVSAIGGTTFNEGTASASYWNTSNNSQLGSAIGYIPEVVWNDTTSTSLSASGGGASRLFSKPGWQVATGVPSDGARDIPDVSFSASAAHDPYLLCTSDTGYSGTNSSGQAVTGACTATTFGAYAVGGTSLSAPSFAGSVALVESANSLKGVGNINPVLYKLSATAGVFHDVTSGNNQIPCATGTLGCTNGYVGYAAGTGYDLATGLGSVDIANLSAALAATVTTTKTTPTVSVTVANTSTTSKTLTIRVSASNSTTTPTGNVTVSVDGSTSGTATLSAGTATYVLSTAALSVGTHTVTVTYAGDANYTTATGTATITVSNVTGNFTFAVTPTTLTLNSSSASTAAWTLTTTANAGFSGLVVYTLDKATGSSLPTAGCFLGTSEVGISSGAAVTSTVTYSIRASDCTSSSAQKVLARLGPAPQDVPVPSRRHVPLLAVGFTGLLGTALLRRRRQGIWITGLLALSFLVTTAGVTGCGSGGTPLSGTTTTTNVTKGTYNLVFTASAYPSGSVTSSVNVTLVVQ